MADLGELSAFAKRRDPTLPDGILAENIEEWRRHKTISFASEVVGTALVLGRETEAEEAARFIKSAGKKAAPIQREIAESILSPVTRDKTSAGEEPRGQIRLLRQRLNQDPHNPVAWSDISLEYACLGLANKARRAMKVAVALAPAHRFIIRSAARLFVHLGEPDYAHYLLLRADSTAVDPWLMAAEIAVAGIAEKASEYAKVGRKLLQAEKFAPWHLSELAGALGTLEFEHGNRRGARKFFSHALVQPTANTVGQARWVQSATGLPLLDSLALNTRLAFEARAWQEFYDGGWQESFDQTQRWLDDEPYSSRPAVLGSYVAGSILGQYDEAVRMARAGLKANPNEPTLLNNLIFSLINCGELDEAEQNLDKLKSGHLEEGHKILLKATTGLLCFRQGNANLGREYYLAAIQMAGEAKNRILQTRAAIFLALEETRAKSPHIQEATARAFKYAESATYPDFPLLLTRLKADR
jgi:Flp pilus assembly protein TadD